MRKSFGCIALLLYLGAEVSIGQIIKAGITAVFEKVRRIKVHNYAQGDYSTAATQGIYSTAATQGIYSTAATNGDYSTAIANGDNSIALANGCESIAKAALGCYIVLTEYRDGELVDCQCRKVDGEKIKPDTFYRLVGGEFVEVEEC